MKPTIETAEEIEGAGEIGQSYLSYGGRQLICCTHHRRFQGVQKSDGCYCRGVFFSCRILMRNTRSFTCCPSGGHRCRLLWDVRRGETQVSLQRICLLTCGWARVSFRADSPEEIKPIRDRVAPDQGERHRGISNSVPR